MKTVRIIGAGLAGSEAAWQCARRGVAVELYEMRPVRSTRDQSVVPSEWVSSAAASKKL